MPAKNTRKKKQNVQKQPTSPTKDNGAKPEMPTIVIPLTPVSTSTVSGSPPGDRSTSPDHEHEAYTTPPTSARTPPIIKVELPSPLENTVENTAPQPKPDPPAVSAKDIVSPEILSLAEFHLSMKNALHELGNTFERLESQSQKMNSLAIDIKTREQLSFLRTTLQEQISRQKAELDAVKKTLELKVKEALTERIRSQVKATMEVAIPRIIEDRVRQELTGKIPDTLIGHRRQILEVKTNLHNSEARRYNASLQSAALTAPLRPLLRPLPTPEQSPVPVIVTTAVDGSTLNSPTLPLSAFPHPPAPTPIKRSTSSVLPSAISRSHSLQPIVPSIPSHLFPKDLRSLFALGPDATRTLLREYGLESTVSTPIVEEAKQKAVKPKTIPEEPESEDDSEEIVAHVEDMNKFMAHIGVPFLMVPPPKQKETNAERRRKLAPLIINTAPVVR